jgi:HSP20 family molecular chaperone IbpA
MSLLLRGLSKEFMKEISAKSREVYELMLPPVDMFEDGSDLVIVLDMPGFEKSKIKTRLHQNSLVVSAKREPLERDGVTYWEQRPLSIHKRIALPVKVRMEDDEEDDAAAIGQVKAKYENGVLTVKLPIKDVGTIPVE